MLARLDAVLAANGALRAARRKSADAYQAQLQAMVGEVQRLGVRRSRLYRTRRELGTAVLLPGQGDRCTGYPRTEVSGEP